MWIITVLAALLAATIPLAMNKVADPKKENKSLPAQGKANRTWQFWKARPVRLVILVVLFLLLVAVAVLTGILQVDAKPIQFYRVSQDEVYPPRIEIKNELPFTEIVYTVDGTDPEKSSTALKYEGPIPIYKKTTINALRKWCGIAWGANSFVVEIEEQSEKTETEEEITSPTDEETMDTGAEDTSAGEEKTGQLEPYFDPADTETEETNQTNTETNTAEEDEDTIQEQNDIIDKDREIHFFVSKQDSTKGIELPGATLQIWEGDTIVKEWISGTEPCEIEALKTDTEYTLHEVQAPEGYIPSYDMIFKFDKEGRIWGHGATKPNEKGDAVLVVKGSVKSSFDIEREEEGFVFDGQYRLTGSPIDTNTTTYVFVRFEWDDIGFSYTPDKIWNRYIRP